MLQGTALFLSNVTLITEKHFNGYSRLSNQGKPKSNERLNALAKRLLCKYRMEYLNPNALADPKGAPGTHAPWEVSAQWGVFLRGVCSGGCTTPDPEADPPWTEWLTDRFKDYCCGMVIIPFWELAPPQQNPGPPRKCVVHARFS